MAASVGTSSLHYPPQQCFLSSVECKWKSRTCIELPEEVGQTIRENSLDPSLSAVSWLRGTGFPVTENPGPRRVGVLYPVERLCSDTPAPQQTIPGRTAWPGKKASKPALHFPPQGHVFHMFDLDEEALEAFL